MVGIAYKTNLRLQCRTKAAMPHLFESAQLIEFSAESEKYSAVMWNDAVVCV